MKKIFSVLAIMMMAVTSIFAADDKKVSVIDKNVPVEYFNKIVLKGSDKIIFTQGDKPSVRIHGIKEMVDAVVVNQDGKTLTVSRNSSFNNGDVFVGLWNALKNETIEVVIYVTSPDLIDVQLTGSGDFKGKGRIDSDKLDLGLRGSGDIDFDDIVCDAINVTLVGSGDVEIDRVESITSNVQLQGSGDVKIKQNNVRVTSLNLYGSGDIEVVCSKCDKVNASLQGSGDITVVGQYNRGDSNERGSGDINWR